MSYTAVTKQGGGTPEKKKLKMGKRQFVMFGFLAAALVLQALPVGIVTYTELYANGGLEGVVSAFSYFHPGGPLLFARPSFLLLQSRWSWRCL